MSPARARLAAIAGVMLTLPAGLAAQGRVFVSHDEFWTNSSFFAASERQLMGDMLAWFGASPGSRVYLYSNNATFNNGGSLKGSVTSGAGL